MKKKIIWIGLLALVTVFGAGCRADIERDDDIDGNDWRTYRYYFCLDWNTPDGKKELMAAGYQEAGVIILAPNQEKYEPFPDCPLKDGIHDLDTVENSMQMKDVNGDGYDDLCADDKIDGEIISEVFLYDPESNAFVYFEEQNTGKNSLSRASAPADADYSKFAGDWYVDGSLKSGHISIDADGHVESCSYDGMVNYEGELRREEYENPDGSTGYLYNIYDDGGEFVTGFYEPEEEDFYELFSGQDGAVHYVRSDHCTDDPGAEDASLPSGN